MGHQDGVLEAEVPEEEAAEVHASSALPQVHGGFALPHVSREKPGQDLVSDLSDGSMLG